MAVYKITESPPTWYDEGLVIQPAINLAKYGSLSVQFAPGDSSSAWFISTGFPVIYPISLMFKWLGVGLMAARLVMVFYIILLVLVFYWLAKKLVGIFYALFSMALVATFAPLYGNGKNVLGEVPGLFFLLAALLFLTKIQKTETSQPRLLYRYYILAGAAIGLSIASKPIFLLLLPALALAFIVKRRQLYWNWSLLFIFTAAVLTPILLWLTTQFDGGRSLVPILSYYSNPYGVSDIWRTVGINARRFVLEASPLYLSFMILVWVGAIAIRIRRRITLSFIEVVSAFFTLLILLAYLRTAGWYRYFFPAQIMAFLYFPCSLVLLAEYPLKRFAKAGTYITSKHLAILILFSLIVFQAYQAGFNSWVADSYDSNRTQILSGFFGRWTGNQSVFIYNSPELVLFLPTSNYYQYLALTDSFILGQEQLKLIADRKVDRIIVKHADLEKSPSLFVGYRVSGAIDRYEILTK